jgi:hypothetical protein
LLERAHARGHEYEVWVCRFAEKREQGLGHAGGAGDIGREGLGEEVAGGSPGVRFDVDEDAGVVLRMLLVRLLQ